jgi:hypothetical protein
MASIIDRNTKNLMTAKLQKELSDLFAEQESSRRPRYNMRPLKAGSGIRVGGPNAGLEYVPGDSSVDNVQTDFGSLNDWQNDNMQWNNTASNPLGITNKSNAPTDFLKNIGSVIPGMAALSPVVSNLFSGLGKSQQLNARDYYNPRRDQISSLMRDRRVNIQPQLDAVLNAERTGQYNLRNSANSRGELMGNNTALYNNSLRNRASIYAGKDNADLGYKGQEAESLMNLGAGEQQANWNTMDYNNQNIANKRNMWRAGLSQLSQYSQTKELMGNQKERDKQLANIYPDMFASIAKFMPGIQALIDSLNKGQNGG